MFYFSPIVLTSFRSTANVRKYPIQLATVAKAYALYLVPMRILASKVFVKKRIRSGLFASVETKITRPGFCLPLLMYVVLCVSCGFF